jgi:hypothetical protein
VAVDLASAALWGFGATVVLTTVVLAAQSLGITRIDMPFVLGTMLTPDRDRAKVLGYALHFLIGWAVTLLYALFFAALGRASWASGLLFGLVQGAVVCVAALPLLPGIHPRMVSDARGPEPTRLLEPPGFLATNYGRWTPLVLLLAHGLFGLVVGSFYRVPGGR